MKRALFSVTSVVALGLGVSVVGAASLMTPAEASTTSTKAASADTYVDYHAPSSNYGTSPRWSAQGSTNYWRRAFLKFAVPAPAAGQVITGVTLRAKSYTDGESTGSGTAVYTVSNSWTETGATWSNAPARGTWLATKGGYAANTWVSWDVTAGVQPAVKTGGGTVSFDLESTEKNWLGFYSRENSTAKPELVITTSDATTTVAPSPTPTAPPTTTAPDPTPTPTPTPTPAAPTTSTEAAVLHGWGPVVAGDEFNYTGAPDSTKWGVYNSVGHAGNGLRSPAAWNVDGSVATVTGDSAGTTGGMSAKFDRRKYGRWEARMRTSARDPKYHPVLILWPDTSASTCPEVDYAEGTTDTTMMNFFLHYGCGGVQTTTRKAVDTTQWHNYAVEWTPTGITGYIDGVQTFQDTTAAHQPPGSMHQTIQLDWFPDGTATKPSWMQVDWVRVYNVDTTATATTTAPAPVTTSPTPTPTPTTTSPTSAAVTKVLTFVEENHSLSQMQSGMPYTFGLAKQYGYATSYTAIRHPSLPNYVAIAGGQTYGIADDNAPSSHLLNGQTIFGQALAKGKTAKVYADGMQSNCALVNGGTKYAVKHNPWAYFTPTAERSGCNKYDVNATALDTDATNGTLPNVGMVIPNLCNDAHDCSLATADGWFQARMAKIMAGPDWKSGHLAVVLTADEDDSLSGNKVLTVVIHPSQKAHVVSTALTHYSLTRLYEDVVGAPYLYNAATAPSMSAAFGLPLS